MFNREEFEEAREVINDFIFLNKMVVGDQQLVERFHQSFSDMGFEINGVDDVEKYLKIHILRDVLSSYLALGYPRYYDEYNYKHFVLLVYIFIGNRGFISFDDYLSLLTEPEFEEVRNGYESFFVSLLNFIDFKSFVVYTLLGEYNPIYADLYMDAMQKLAQKLAEETKYITPDGQIWLYRLLNNPKSFIRDTNQEEDHIFYTDTSFFIEKSYFDLLEKVVGDLISFMNKNLIHSELFLSTIQSYPSYSNLELNLDSLGSIIMQFVKRDIHKIYKELGHDTNIDTVEGKFFFYFVLRNLNKYTYYEFNALCNQKTDNMEIIRLREACQNTIDMSKGIELEFEDQEFILPFFLDKIGEDLSKQYKIILYRCSSVIAKADGKISENESRWLSHLLSVAGMIKNKSNSKTEIVITKETDFFNELQTLIGLESVKKDVVSLTNFIKMKQMRESKGLKVPSTSYHCVFTGNPGTGKTTVARILAFIFKKLGLLKKGHLVETDRSGLVAEFVGQTAIKTNNIIDEALDGVLFVDEAYTLAAGQNDYGKEAIATLLKRMEDDRNRLIVILAGYTKEMEDFINSNPGLRSRFNRYIYFPDYSASELFDIFKLNVEKNEYVMNNEAEEFLKQYLEDVVSHKQKDFGNARYIRNYFELAIEHQANRLAMEPNISIEDITTLTLDDVNIKLSKLNVP